MKWLALLGFVAVLGLDDLPDISISALDKQFESFINHAPKANLDRSQINDILLEVNSFKFDPKKISVKPVTQKKQEEDFFLPQLPAVSDQEVESFIETSATARSPTPILAPANYDHAPPPTPRVQIPTVAAQYQPVAPTFPMPQYSYVQPMQQFSPQMQFVQQPQYQYMPQYQPMIQQAPAPLMNLQPAQQQLYAMAQPTPAVYPQFLQQPQQVVPDFDFSGQPVGAAAMRFRAEPRFPEFQSEVRVLPRSDGPPSYAYPTENGRYQPFSREITPQDMRFSQKVRANNHPEPVLPDMPPPPVTLF